MNKVSDQLATYIKDVESWRQEKEDSLRSEDGWLTLAGLFWLHERKNTLGSDPASDVALPSAGIAEMVGTIDFRSGVVSLKVAGDESVLVDGIPATSAILRDDLAEGGPSLVKIAAITFFVIRRGDQYGIRVRDANSPELQSFTGRKWFDINADYRLTANFVQHDPVRTVPMLTSIGLQLPMDNLGYVEFSLHGQAFSLEALSEDEGELWFIFKDGTSGNLTYSAGRYLKAPFTANRPIELDFNKAYNPPCVFTKYTSCPLPPKENVLPIAIEAGEKV